MSFASWLSDKASGVWSFMSQKEVAASFALGAASGAANYLAQKDQQKYERDMYDRKMRDRDERYKGSTVGQSEYGSHAKNLTGGLLTQGKITKEGS